MFLFERVDAMEFEVVEVKVPRGMIPEGYELIVDVPCGQDIVLSKPLATQARCSLVARPKPIKPAWNPPRGKKGWVTWDTTGGWYFWLGPDKPRHTFDIGWVDAKTGCGDGGLYISEEMAEFLGCPDCTGFDERNCIWEVGE